jgi:hypothetical protein
MSEAKEKKQTAKELKKENLIKSIKEASRELKEKYEFQLVKTMKLPPHPNYKTWKPEAEDHPYIEAVKNGNLSKIKIEVQESSGKTLKSNNPDLDYILYFYWFSNEDFSTELVLQVP